MKKIKVKTLFDITATGVVGHYKPSRGNFRDQAGNLIVDIDSWNRSRNQQRNWETLTQLIQLRTQIMDLDNPVINDNVWIFHFTVEQDVFDDGTDPVGVLKADCNGVPMLLELNNDPDIESILVTAGPRQNIWFTSEPINNILEN